ncbi:MAG: TIGR02646 family protein [Chitinophagales bacterium]|nr:TIGR02646 family protein [Chitinophagales bacterium]
MIKIIRPQKPTCLELNAEQWNNDYVERRAENLTCQFSWRTYERKPVNEHLEPVLLEMTKNHCAFCDCYELGADIKPTIEHFDPKTRSPHLAYEWTNLFPACHYCQEKNNAFDEQLLKPDKEDYDFYRYFYFDDATGELEPNPQATPEEQTCAEITIRLYRLNGSERRKIKEKRLTWVKRFRAGLVETDKIDDYPYRYLYSV